MELVANAMAGRPGTGATRLKPDAARVPALAAAAVAGGGDLTSAEFRRVGDLLYKVARITLGEGKQALVRARLWKRVRALGLSGYAEYLAFVESGAGKTELRSMIDALTTNKTSFFREVQHFEFLREELPEHARTGNRLRIWSAGCSSGQEPYTLAIVLQEVLTPAQRADALILATDISQPILAAARSGVYDDDEVDGVSPAQLRRWFAASRTGVRTQYRVSDDLRTMVRFARLNLMEPWPMKGPFDFIFCRNVMIYFDRPTQEKLVRGFHGVLRPGGCLLVGHSESLTGRVEGLTYVRPAVYRK
jgi:chemotaxis protein methyltransferase CheR